METTYVSIDVATRSLAIGLYQMKPFNNFQKLENPISFNDYMNEIINPLVMRVYDINEGKKAKETNILDKAEALKQTLESFDLLIQGNNIKVIIEYQMCANHLSNAIFNMIVYHYSNRYPIHVIKPSLKNTIALHPKLTLANFLASSTSNYTANKLHTRCNMLYLLTMIDKLEIIDDIKKKNQDDIADTLMQAIAFHKSAV